MGLGRISKGAPLPTAENIRRFVKVDGITRHQQQQNQKSGQAFNNNRSSDRKEKGIDHNDRHDCNASPISASTVANKQKDIQTQLHNVKENKPQKMSGPKTQQTATDTRLLGAQFRLLNEDLYTETSSKMYEKFQQDESLFKVYHEGFNSQTKTWSVNPVDIFISWLKGEDEFKYGASLSNNKQKKAILTRSDFTCCGNSNDFCLAKDKRQADQKQLSHPIVVADMGCGEAKLAQTFDCDNLKERIIVRSFDMGVNDKNKKYVEICNITATPMENNAVDVVIFSLSLMGTDYNDFIKEASRILKEKGMLWIAEVSSRIEDPAMFQSFITSFGFRSIGYINMNYFSLFTFVKVPLISVRRPSKSQNNMAIGPNHNDRSNKIKNSREVSDSRWNKVLKPCIYKRR